MRMIQGRWKLPILFRLFADPSLRTLQLKRDLPGYRRKC
jgi:DNA-binding HxlR family transcriptional regulator